MVYNLPANVGDTGSSPDLGRSYMPQSNSTHTSQLLSLCSRPQKLQPLKLKSPRAWCFATRDATSVRSLSTAKSSPCSQQLDKSPRGIKDPEKPKVNK